MLRHGLADQARGDVKPAAGGKADDEVDRPHWIIERGGEARQRRQRGRGAGELQEAAACRLHGDGLGGFAGTLHRRSEPRKGRTVAPCLALLHYSLALCPQRAFPPVRKCSSMGAGHQESKAWRRITRMSMTTAIIMVTTMITTMATAMRRPRSEPPSPS